MESPLDHRLLKVAAEAVDDIERTRIANENRLRQLVRAETDSDDADRGFGLTVDHPAVDQLAHTVRSMLCDSTVAVALIGKKPDEKAADKDLRKLLEAAGLTLPKRPKVPCCLEHESVRRLERQLRDHTLAPWVSTMRGIGPKQGARLIAAVGDPAWNDLTDDWRSLRQLYSYCGYGDAAKQVRRKGERLSWSPDAKMRLHLVVKSTVVTLRAPCTRPEGQEWADHVDGCQCSPYRVVYDQGRQQYADAVHDEECRRCGPKGAPAQPGSLLPLAHQEARAYRKACKALLHDLWREARRLHGFDDDPDVGHQAA